MAEFYHDNLAKNLPDAYKKNTSSNNYKILEIERAENADLRERLNEIANILDVNNATGKTLDLYGKRYGQERGRATDQQYILMIRSKIVRALSNGSYKSIIDAICYTFGCTKDDVLLEEVEGKPMTFRFTKTPLEKIVTAGFTARQAEQIIKSLLPVCSTLESVLFEGTFEFSKADAEYDAETGFGESTTSEIGGYLGWTGSDQDEGDLPI